MPVELSQPSLVRCGCIAHGVRDAAVFPESCDAALAGAAALALALAVDGDRVMGPGLPGPLRVVGAAILLVVAGADRERFAVRVDCERVLRSMVVAHGTIRVRLEQHLHAAGGIGQVRMYAHEADVREDSRLRNVHRRLGRKIGAIRQEALRAIREQPAPDRGIPAEVRVVVQR